MNHMKNIIKFRKRFKTPSIRIDSSSAYNEKYLKAKIKSWKINTNWKNQQNFHNNKISKEGTQCICLSVILIDSVFREVIIITLKCF